MKDNKYFTREPLIHSHITDVLVEQHPLAYEQVYCDKECGALLHAANNECMQTWYETEFGNFCTLCFFLNEVLGSIDDCFFDGNSIRKRCLESFAAGLKIGREQGYIKNL